MKVKMFAFVLRARDIRIAPGLSEYVSLYTDAKVDVFDLVNAEKELNMFLKSGIEVKHIAQSAIEREGYFNGVYLTIFYENQKK